MPISEMISKSSGICFEPFMVLALVGICLQGYWIRRHPEDRFRYFLLLAVAVFMVSWRWLIGAGSSRYWLALNIPVLFFALYALEFPLRIAGWNRLRWRWLLTAGIAGVTLTGALVVLLRSDRAVFFRQFVVPLEKIAQRPVRFEVLDGAKNWQRIEYFLPPETARHFKIGSNCRDLRKELPEALFRHEWLIVTDKPRLPEDLADLVREHAPSAVVLESFSVADDKGKPWALIAVDNRANSAFGEAAETGNRVERTGSVVVEERFEVPADAGGASSDSLPPGWKFRSVNVSGSRYGVQSRADDSGEGGLRIQTAGLLQLSWKLPAALPPGAHFDGWLHLKGAPGSVVRIRAAGSSRGNPSHVFCIPGEPGWRIYHFSDVAGEKTNEFILEFERADIVMDNVAVGLQGKSEGMP